MAAVERKTLLRLLQEQAVQAGVELRFSTEAELDDVMAGGPDLVIAADGANSRIRERFADVFAPTVETATAKFIWLGTTYPFDGLTFVHERSEHGVFAVHGYPIGNGLSTFIVETDEASWRAAGLDEFDVTQPPGASDEKSREYLQRLFCPRIDGHELLVNNSRWGNFRTRRAGRWRHRVGDTSIALLGDAAHTAHFSVGSGTKMALEDAIALAATIAGEADLDAALAAYESERQPDVARVHDSARPSLSWWEHFGRSYDAMPGWQFAYHFFTRALSDARLTKRAPDFVNGSHQAWKRAHGDGPLASPLLVAGHRVDGRRVGIADGAVQLGELRVPLRDVPMGHEVWGLRLTAPAAEEGLSAALDLVADAAVRGACLVYVDGGTALTRRLICEAARLEHGLVSVLVENGDERYGVDDSALTAVLSGRTDLVAEPEPDA